MKVKIIKPVSRFFKVGQIAEMTISNKRGDFVLSTDKFSQSFSFSYHKNVKPVTYEEFAAILITKTENEIIQKE